MSLLMGPVLLMLIQTSATREVRAAIAFNIGACMADIVFIITAVGFSYKLLQTIKNEPILYITGGTVKVFYGLFSLRQPQKAIRIIERIKIKRKLVSFL